MQQDADHFRDLFVGAGVRHVVGSVERVTVTGGATVAVQGTVDGPVTIDRGAKLCVDGLFSGWVERNEGLLVISGQANLDLTQRMGRVGIAVGTTIVCTRTRPAGSKAWTLTEEGTLRRIPRLGGVRDVAVDQLHYFQDAPPPLAS
ncbi:MAG TPA: hypothetical protein VFM09_00600 [Marmoricola sp.]|nr:hypothetical protein [Marmoricola sp.]